jgi:hypothetical protein
MLVPLNRNQTFNYPGIMKFTIFKKDYLYSLVPIKFHAGNSSNYNMRGLHGVPSLAPPQTDQEIYNFGRIESLFLFFKTCSCG